MRPLPVPPQAESSDNALEIVRGWLVDGRLQCSLAPTMFPDPITWGILLADVATHVANALHEIAGANRNEVLAGIARAFAREMKIPTDEHTGEVLKPETRTAAEKSAVKKTAAKKKLSR